MVSYQIVLDTQSRTRYVQDRSFISAWCLESKTPLRPITPGAVRAVAKRYSSFLHFYHRIQRDRGGDNANIALARKFLGVIYDTLKNNRVFEDSSNLVLPRKQAKI